MTLVPQEARDAEQLAERITVQLQHGNSAVILTAVKVLLYLMNYMENRKLMDYICKKMGPPLGGLAFHCHASHKTHVSSQSQCYLLVLRCNMWLYGISFS